MDAGYSGIDQVSDEWAACGPARLYSIDRIGRKSVKEIESAVLWYLGKKPKIRGHYTTLDARISAIEVQLLTLNDERIGQRLSAIEGLLLKMLELFSTHIHAKGNQ